jgi:hypothetical protein
MSACSLRITSNQLGFDMGLVAIICPICVHVGFTLSEQLPRVLTCSRCHHQQNFSSPRPRQRPNEGDQYATDGLMPYRGHQSGQPTLHEDIGARTLPDPEPPFSRSAYRGGIGEKASTHLSDCPAKGA